MYIGHLMAVHLLGCLDECELVFDVDLYNFQFDHINVQVTMHYYLDF